MKQTLRANITLTLETDNTVEMRNIVNLLKQMIENNLDKRIGLVNTDVITVKPISTIRNTVKVDLAARNFIGAIQNNVCNLWKPDFSNTVEAIIVNPTHIKFENSEGNYDGISLQMGILMNKLGIETDY